MSSTESRWRSPWPWIGGFLAVAALGIGVAAILFASWTEIQNAAPDQAANEFAAALATAATAGPQAATPYLHIDVDGHVQVHRELESATPTDLRHLHLLAWDPHNDKLLHAAFPYWFVRVKMNDTINLGTMTTALSGDWDNLDLKVSVAELRRRGAGIVLDHIREDGVRLLLWNEVR